MLERVTMTNRFGLREKVAFLRDPASYADGTSVVEAVETHFAWIFLTERHAYKLKKPVRHEQMDYRTLAAREHGCHEEVRLNRRLAPTVYEGVVALSERAGRLMLGPGGRPVDWLVKMIRLPAARMLDQALPAGAVTKADLDRIARKLVRFFDQASPSRIAAAQYRARLRARVSANREAFERYGTRLPQRLAAEVAALQLDIIRRASVVLGERGAHVVEGHGDLRAEHVYLGPPVAIIDCLEFDRDLRLLDPVEEMALLALEIEQLDRTDLATHLLQRFSVLADRTIPSYVLDFYMSHRAAARARVAAWHLDDPQFPDPQPWIARTHSLLEAAARHAEEARHGLDASAGRGSGKRVRTSALARRPPLKQRAER